MSGSKVGDGVGFDFLGRGWLRRSLCGGRVLLGCAGALREPGR